MGSSNVMVWNWSSYAAWVVSWAAVGLVPPVASTMTWLAASKVTRPAQSSCVTLISWAANASAMRACASSEKGMTLTMP